MERIYRSVEQLIGNTPLLELNRYAAAVAMPDDFDKYPRCLQKTAGTFLHFFRSREAQQINALFQQIFCQRNQTDVACL